MHEFDRYIRMVERWREIVARPISEAAKTEMCLSVLEEYMGDLAMTRVRQANPSLRFYADMIVLAQNTIPLFTSDSLGQLAVVPASRRVREWLSSNTQTRQ